MMYYFHDREMVAEIISVMIFSILFKYEINTVVNSKCILSLMILNDLSEYMNHRVLFLDRDLSYNYLHN